MSVRRPAWATIAAAAMLASSLTQAPTIYAGPTSGNDTVESLPSDDIPIEWQEAITDVQRRLPALSYDDAYDRISAQERRLALREDLLETLGADRLAGSRYDLASNTTTVLIVDLDDESIVQRLAAEHNIRYIVELVEFSYYELTALADTITTGLHPLLSPVTHYAFANDDRNTVDAYVPRTSISALQAQGAQLHPAIRLLPMTVNLSVDEACTGKLWQCGAPLRGGIGVWDETEKVYPYYQTPNCSLGYTATGSDGSWWAISGGHCSRTNNINADEDFGHGQQEFGPMRGQRLVSQSPFNLDYLRARIDNSYWRQQMPAGYLVQVNSSNNVVNDPVRLSWYIGSRMSIDIDDYVCLVAQSPDSGDACGPIDSVYATYGMPQVAYDACEMDSGGAWVWRASYGYVAFGIHQGGRTSCPQVLDPPRKNNSQGWSQFTTIPDLHAHWDDTLSVTLRIDYR